MQIKEDETNSGIPFVSIILKNLNRIRLKKRGLIGASVFLVLRKSGYTTCVNRVPAAFKITA